MEATTNSTLVLILKTFYKAEIQTRTKLVNIKARKTNQKLFLQKVTDQCSGQPLLCCCLKTDLYTQVLKQITKLQE